MEINQISRFTLNPSVDIQRSKFERNSDVKFSFNVGDLVPFYVDEVLPGDTFTIDTSKVVRMQPLVAPIMDNLYLDTYWFFVPNRLVWDHWKNFCGENTANSWIPSVEYFVPKVTGLISTDATADSNEKWKPGGIADYMGIPVCPSNVKISSDYLQVNALPFRGYALIWNEFFRDQNLQDPIPINTGDQGGVLDASETLANRIVWGSGILKACKYHDYFTSCLPAPQKGPDVNIPLSGLAKVITGNESSAELTGKPISFSRASDKVNLGYLNGLNSNQLSLNTTEAAAGNLVPNNLYASLGSASLGTINELRLAFQMQRIYEKDARGGTRYTEILKNHFGVTSPDARLQRPEYLGGSRIPININQVVQTSSTSNTPQGNTAAFSVTADVHSDFTKSFVEHGFIFGLCVARYDHTYQQGLERFWSRSDRFDYYWPSLANIGEQPVKRKEIYCTGIADNDDRVFGYQEAWADYRYKPSRVAGEMRSRVPNTLDVWHLADNYEGAPFLSAEWIQEDSSNLNRALAVSDSVSNQLWADIFIKNTSVRPMPIYSIPGLIDHY